MMSPARKIPIHAATTPAGSVGGSRTSRTHPAADPDSLRTPPETLRPDNHTINLPTQSARCECLTCPPYSSGLHFRPGPESIFRVLAGTAMCLQFVGSPGSPEVAD